MTTTYVVYYAASTVEVARYQRLHHARARAKKQNEKAVAKGVPGAICSWSTLEHYAREIVHMVDRRNALNGVAFKEPSNTPYYCSPSSETYWSA